MTLKTFWRREVNSRRRAYKEKNKVKSEKMCDPVFYPGEQRLPFPILYFMPHACRKYP